MHIETFHDPASSTLSHLVYHASHGDAVVIDPVLDYDPVAAITSTAGLEAIGAFVDAHGLRLRYVLETHAHADHLSGAQYLRRRYGAPIVIGRRITEVQEVFRDVFDLGPDFAVDGRQFDRLVSHGEALDAGSLTVRVLETPGHTPACVSYLVGDALFTGDALFIEDYGTGRCDFPRGDAIALYHSVHQTLYALPDATRVFVGHDYQPGGRALRHETTIERSKAENVQLSAATSEAEFVALRRERDRTLAPPRLLYPAVQVNIAGGRLPAPAHNGVRYLKIPIDRRRPTEDDGSRPRVSTPS